MGLNPGYLWKSFSTLRKAANSSDPLVAKIIADSRKILFDEELISKDDLSSDEILPQPTLSGMGGSSGKTFQTIWKKISVARAPKFGVKGGGGNKVHIFWEGHKIVWNLHLKFDYSTHSQI